MNANQLAKHLGYGSSEKISRLGRDKNTKPGFDLLVDLANMFESVPLYWLITGKNGPDESYETLPESDSSLANEPQGSYTKLPARHSFEANNLTNEYKSDGLDAHFQELLNEKERVIRTLQEVIDAQKDTITLLKENRSI